MVSERSGASEAWAQSLPRLQQERRALLARLRTVEAEAQAATAILGMVAGMAEEIRSFYRAIEPLAQRHFVKMQNKRVWFDRENAALFPMFEAVSLPVLEPGAQAVRAFPGLDFEGYRFVPMTQGEFRRSFLLDAGNPYLQGRDGFAHFSPETYHTVVLTREVRGTEAHWCWVNGSDGWYSSGRRATLVPIYRLGGEDSPPMDALQAVCAWLALGLVPDGMEPMLAMQYRDVLALWQAGYICCASSGLALRQASFLRAVISGRLRRRFFRRAFDWAAVLGRQAKGAPKGAAPDAAARTEARADARDGRELLMDEKERVRLSREILAQIVYPQEVYYDGTLLVDTFINTRGNYVQGYVPAGSYRVASVNTASKTVQLNHSRDSQKIFRRNPACHSPFETFSAPFSHVYVARSLLPQAGREQADVDYGKALAKLQQEGASLEGRLAAVEQQMKRLMAVEDPRPAAAPAPAPGVASFTAAASPAAASKAAPPNRGAAAAPKAAAGRSAPPRTPAAGTPMTATPGGALSDAAAPVGGRQSAPPQASGGRSGRQGETPTERAAAMTPANGGGEPMPPDDIAFLDWQPSPPRSPAAKTAAAGGAAPPPREEESAPAPHVPRASSRRRGSERVNDRRAAMAERRAAERRRRRPSSGISSRAADLGDALFDKKE